MSTLGTQVLDVRPQGLGDAEAVEPEEQDEGEGPGVVGLGGSDEGGQFVTVEASGHGVGPHLRAADVGHGVPSNEVLGDGVLVEPSEGAQVAGDGGGGAAIYFGQGAGIGVDMDSLGGQGVDSVVLAPREPGTRSRP